MRLPHNLICTNKSKRNMKIENTDEETSTGFVPAYIQSVLKIDLIPYHLSIRYTVWVKNELLSSFPIQ